MKEQNEREIKKEIADYLRLRKFLVINHRNVGIYKKDTGKYIPLSSGEKGVSDLLCCSLKGEFWAIEVKKKGGRLTVEQVDFLERVKKNKGRGYVAYSLDDIMKIVEKE